MENNKLKLAVFKLESGEYESAKPLLEELAINENSPEAWGYLGLLRLDHIQYGSYTVNQAISCMRNMNPVVSEMQSSFQKKWANISGAKAKYFLDLRKQMKRKVSGSALKMIGNSLLILTGALIGMGAKKNRVFAGALGGGSAAAGGFGIGKNVSSRREAKQMIALCENMLQQLNEGILEYCYENEKAAQIYLDWIAQGLQAGGSSAAYVRKSMYPTLGIVENTNAKQLT